MPQELLLTGPRTLDLAPYDEAPLAPDEVRAEAVLSAISHGTELSLYRGTSPFGEKRFDPALRLFVPSSDQEVYPLKLGYEWVGRVTDVGSDVTEFHSGDLVHLPLPHRETHTFKVDARVREGILGHLPSGLETEQAVLLETTGIALQAVHDAAVKVGNRVAVFGMGALGLLALQLARLNGAAWLAAVDPLATRRAFAERLGADLTIDPQMVDVGLELKKCVHPGVDVAIEFSGHYGALHEAMRSVRPAGTVVAAGFYQGGAAALRLGEEWHHNRLTMISSMRGWGNPHRDYPAWDRGRLRTVAAHLLREGLDVSGFVTHRFPFGRAAEAYALVEHHPAEALKVVLTY